MATQVFPVFDPAMQFFDFNGIFLTGGLVYTFQSDGVTPQATWMEPTGVTANSNPIVLDAYGRCTIYGNSQLVLAVHDSAGNLIYSKPTASADAALNISQVGLTLLTKTSTAAMLGYLGAQAAAGGTVVTQGVVPWGGVLPYAGLVAPTGWALCQGQPVSRTSYPNTFAVLGTIWGVGDGSTTFNLPNMCGRVWAGHDPTHTVLTVAGSGINSAVGIYVGDEHSQLHTHAIVDPGHVHGVIINKGTQIAAGGISGGSSLNFGDLNSATYSAVTGISAATYGAGGEQNIPPTAIGNFIIQLG